MTEIRDKAIVLAGGAGFLGRVLARHLRGRGFRVVVLSRRPVGDEALAWDGRTLGPWGAALEGAVGVINLAGRSVNCRYTRRNRAAIMNSRVDSTRVLGEAIARCRRPPAVWLNASTATIYQHSLDRAMDEPTGVIAATPEAKDAFSIEVARAWEETLAATATPGTRKVALRAAMVLARDPGGVLHALVRLCKLRLGGAMAGGRQFVSWIHERDFCRAVDFVLEHPELAGAVNLAAPGPVPNAQLMAMLRRAVGVRVGLPAARWMLEVGAFFMRTETELILKSRRVVPTRLLEAGFAFDFPDIQSAIADLI